MRRPTLKQNFTASNPLMVQLWQYLKEALEPLLADTRSVRSVLPSIVLTAATPKVINHMLILPVGTTPEGWEITDRTAAGTIYRSAWTHQTITLVSSATMTVQLEVW